MRFRVACIVAAGLAVAAVLAWPMAAERLARRIEDRLARETGRDWRVGAVGFAGSPFTWSPALLLSDVDTGDSRAGLGVARLTVPLSRTLISGGVGTVPLRAEGVTARLPVDGARTGGPARGADRPSPQDPRLSAIHARLHGVDVALSGDGRRLDVSSASAEIDLDLDPSAAEPAIDVTVEDPGTRFRIELDRPGPDAARTVRLDLTPDSTRPDTPSVRVAASLKAGPDQVSIERITGTLSQSPVSGGLRLVLTDRPVLTAELRLDDLTVLAGRDDALPGSARGPKVSVPTSTLPRPSWFSGFDADLRLAIGRVALGPARFEDVTAKATIREGTLETAVDVARAYESAMKLRYALSRVGGGESQNDVRSAGETGRHRLSVTLAGARLRPLLSDLVGAGGLDARAAARIDLQAIAAHPADLPRTATGFADVTLTEGRVDAADLIGMGADGPFSRFQTLGGSFSIAEGLAVTTDLQLKSPLIQATGAGSLDLVARTLDLRFQPAVTDRRGRAGGGRALDVPIHVSGPWAGPAVSADMSGLLRNPAGAIEVLRDLGTGLMGPQGGGRGAGGFEGLLDAIMPRGGRDAAPVRRR